MNVGGPPASSPFYPLLTPAVVSTCFHTSPACSQGTDGSAAEGHYEIKVQPGPGPFELTREIREGGMD